MAPEDSRTLDHEEFMATEALLISFWREVARLENLTYGALQAPGREARQQGVLTAKAISAALLWLLRQRAELGLPYWNIPFKTWRIKEWPECYLNLDAGSSRLGSANHLGLLINPSVSKGLDVET